MKKRVLSILLTLCMVLTLLPVAAFAADEAPATQPEASAETVKTSNEELTTQAIERPTKPTSGYKITFNGNGGKPNGIFSSNWTSSAYAAGTEVKLSTAHSGKTFVRALSADYSTNYRFKGWNTAANGSGTTYADTDTITMPESNLTLYAQWEAYEWIYWNVTMGEGGDHIDHAKGSNVQSFKAYCGNSGNQYGKVPAAYYSPVKAVAKEGYKFIGWYSGDKLVTDGNLTVQVFNALPALKVATSGATLEARFEPLIKVTYTDGVEGEEIFADQVYYVEKGDETPAFEGTPTRENCTFKGWSPEVSDTVTGDVTYVAQWEKNTKNKPTKKITASNVNNMEIRAYAVGTEGTLSGNGNQWACNPKIHAKGVSYTIGEVQGNDVDGYTIDITFHFASGDTFETNAREVFNGTTYKKDQPEWSGDWSYCFTEEHPADQTLTLYWRGVYSSRYNKYVYNWYTYYNGKYYNNITSNVANLIQIELALDRTVTYTDGVENEEVFADQTYAVRNGSLPTAFEGTPTRTGYNFTGWDTDVTEKIYADTTYTAKWSINQYTLTFKQENGQEDIAVTQDYNTAISAITAPEKEGYTFLGWDKTVPSTMPAENMTFTAKWSVNQYTLTFKPENGQEDIVVKQDYNTAISAITAPEKEGYTFLGWDKTVPSTMPAENMTFTALWQDTAAPVISGLEKNKTYCGSVSFTVSDNEAVTGVTAGDKTLTANKDGSYTLEAGLGVVTVIVTDAAGNKSEITVTVNDGHTGGTATCCKKAVCEICGEEYGEIDSTNHTGIVHVKAAAATKTKEGNVEYWFCKDCGKYFSDKALTKEITKADTVIAKLKNEDEAPKTGDSTTMALWVTLLAMSTAGIMGIGLYGRKRRTQK